MPRKPTLLALMMPCLLALAACSPSEPTSGQIVASVNGSEISVHQLNRLIEQQGEVNDAQRQALIERLVRRELAVQQALAMKLDRQPEVMLRLEEARRDALAAAWSEHAGSTAAPGDNEAARYYAAHPGLFAERKLYRLRELGLPAGSPQTGEMEARLKQVQSFEAIQAWLRGQQVPFTDQTILRPAEQLPIEAVERLRQAAPGQTVAFRSSRALTLYQVQSADPMPVQWPAAAAPIKAFLATQARNQRLESELGRLQAQARIEYPSPKP